MLDFSAAEWHTLDEAGMITYDLKPEEIGQALVVKERHPGLSANDCFCLTTATVYPGILLTGDALLRKIAAGNGLRVHGVLWVVDELEVAEACSRSLLGRALKAWQSDDKVFLPQHEISRRLEYLGEAGPRRGCEGERAAARVLD